jgi:predicted RNA-binding Zn ribbon-like protein
LKHDFLFHHGRLSLSFVGTVGQRTSDRMERIGTPTALADWFVAAGIEPAAIEVPVTGYRRALRLRDAVERAVDAVRRGDAPAASDVAAINAVARAHPARLELDPRSMTVVSTASDRVGAALGRIARDAIELLGSPEERSRLRACGLDTCGSLFLTPAGRRERRWCSMERCGNRAKVASFRERSHAAPAHPARS